MPGDVFLFKKSVTNRKRKGQNFVYDGNLLGAALGCQAAGEYLHETYLKEESVSTSGAVSEKKTVVIDSGHGGKDPGKIGVNGAQEKELNLQIAEKLKAYLEEHGITVIMTRTDDERLANSQVEDLKKRVELINQEAHFPCGMYPSEQLSAGKRKRFAGLLFCSFPRGKKSRGSNAGGAEKI